MVINVVEKTRDMVEPLLALAAIDAVLGAQSVDLRDPSPRDAMGRGPAMLYARLREQVPMLDTDRPPGLDIEAAIGVMKACHSRESGNPASLRAVASIGESKWVPASAGTTGQ